MKRFSIVFRTLVMVAASATLSIAQVPEKLTLEESITIGLTNSKIVHASLMRSQAAESRASEANTATLPWLKLGGQYTRLSDVPPFEASIPAGAFAPGLPQNDLSFPLSQTVLNNYNLRVTALQPIFTGFRLSSASDIASSYALASQADHDRARSDLVFNITSAYWTLFKALEYKKVIDETIDQVNAHLTDVKNLMAQGMATTNDVLRVEVQLSNSRLLQIDAANNVRLSTIGLNTLMGQNIAATFELATRPDSASADSANLSRSQYDELLQRALEHRPEYKSMAYRVEAGNAGVTYAKSGWFPQIYLTGNYYYANPNQRYVPAQDVFHDSWDVSVTAAFDIWNWGLTGHQTDEAKAELQFTKDLQGQLRDNISMEVAQSMLSVNQAKEKIGVSKQAQSQASENYRITNEKYKMGLVLNSDVTDAQVSLLLARTNETQALVDYEIAVAKLRQSIGMF